MGLFISDERIKRLSKFGQIVTGILAFGVLGLLLLAIYYYAGDYDFLTNYISDLGKTMVDGNDNFTSNFIYMLTMVTMGLVSAGFWFFTQNVIYHAFKTKWKYLVIFGSFTGIISAFIIAMTGFYPLDTQPTTHNLLGMVYFVLGGIALSLYAIFFIVIFFANKDEEKFILYSIISLIIPVIFAFIVIEALKGISTIYIIGLVGLLLIINLLFSFAFKSFINYLSYVISFSMLVLEIVIILLVIERVYSSVSPTISAVMEVSFVLGMVAFMMINNVRIFEIDF